MTDNEQKPMPTPMSEQEIEAAVSWMSKCGCGNCREAVQAIRHLQSSLAQAEAERDRAYDLLGTTLYSVWSTAERREVRALLLDFYGLPPDKQQPPSPEPEPQAGAHGQEG